MTNPRNANAAIFATHRCNRRLIRWIAANAFFGLALSSFLLTGCTTESTVSESNLADSGDTQITPAVKKVQTTSVAPSKTEIETSPATASSELPTDASPAVVCQQFMELLKSGSRISAENLLTTAALTATSRAGLKLEPIGGKTARYDMGETRFVTIREKMAHVDCEIVEMIDGKEERAKCCWLVRKQNLGWRIAGLIYESEAGETDLLSFENATDVAKIQEMAVASAMAETDSTRQANANPESELK